MCDYSPNIQSLDCRVASDVSELLKAAYFPMESEVDLSLPMIQNFETMSIKNDRTVKFRWRFEGLRRIINNSKIKWIRDVFSFSAARNNLFLIFFKEPILMELEIKLYVYLHIF